MLSRAQNPDAVILLGPILHCCSRCTVTSSGAKQGAEPWCRYPSNNPRRAPRRAAACQPEADGASPAGRRCRRGPTHRSLLPGPLGPAFCCGGGSGRGTRRVPSALPAPGCRCRALPLLPLPGASGRRSPEPGQTWELVLLEPGLAGQLHSSRLSRSDGLQRGGSAQPCAEQGGGERGDHGEASERICLNRIKRNVGSAKVASARAAWSIAAAPGSAGKASAALPAGSCRALSALPPGK